MRARQLWEEIAGQITRTGFRPLPLLPPARLRWAGVYRQVTTAELYHRSRVADAVVLVTGPGGRGTTCTPAIAGETFTKEAQ